MHPMEFFAGAILGFVCGAVVWLIGFTVARTNYSPGVQGFYSVCRVLLRNALGLISVTVIALVGATFTYGGGISWKGYLTWLFALYVLGMVGRCIADWIHDGSD